MRHLLTFLILVSLHSELAAQFNYAVSAIPKTLLVRAGAVVRNSETTIEVKNMDNVYYRVKEARTILNRSADDQAQITLFYDKDQQIKSVKGTIYNEFGIPTATFSEKNFSDRSAVNDFSLYEDNRVKQFRPAQVSYPFTIEFEYEIRRKQSLFFPDWYPVSTTEVAVENSSLNFICPESFSLRFQEKNLPGKVLVKNDKGINTYQWKVSHLAATRDEPFSPDDDQILCSVKLAPSAFAYRGLEGSFTNWEEYGKWVYENLLKGRDKLPAATEMIVKDLVRDISDPKEKARKIYEFMQSKTRYISIQIGIGGYKPYPAAEVDRFGYGDCKGLVNYMHALLKTVNIQSDYAVVYAGSFKKNMASDFASLNQGNHIILCVPFENDTTWLECTSKTIPFGYLGDFTDDRQVVLCTATGGRLARTPKLKTLENRQIRKADFTILDDGSLTGTMQTEFCGSQYENHMSLLNEPYQEQLKKLPEMYPIPNLSIQKLEFTEDKSASPVSREVVSFQSGGYCSVDEGKLKFSLNYINTFKTGPREIKNRTSPVYINRGFYDEDQIVYHLPAAYKADFPEEKYQMERPFGRYEAQVQFQKNKIVYTRKMQLNEGFYKPELYQELVDFFQYVIQADSRWLSLSK